MSEVHAIVAQGVSKRFRTTTIKKHASMKAAIVKFDFLKRIPREDRFVQAVSDVSFSVPAGSSIGIIGRNGSGKTTLMRLLAGIYKPDTGSLRVSGVAPLLSLGVGFHPEMSGRENVRINGLVLGLNPKEIDERFESIVAFSELEEFIDAPLRTYSSGMSMRLAFAVAVSIDPDVLLLDEVLAVGDEAFAEKCLARMREFKVQKKTMVLVTHDPTTLVTWCDTAIWMDRGSLRAFGPAKTVVDAYHEDLRQVAALVSQA